MQNAERASGAAAAGRPALAAAAACGGVCPPQPRHRPPALLQAPATRCQPCSRPLRAAPLSVRPNRSGLGPPTCLGGIAGRPVTATGRGAVVGAGRGQHLPWWPRGLGSRGAGGQGAADGMQGALGGERRGGAGRGAQHGARQLISPLHKPQARHPSPGFRCAPDGRQRPGRPRREPSPALWLPEVPQEVRAGRARRWRACRRRPGPLAARPAPPAPLLRSATAAPRAPAPPLPLADRSSPQRAAAGPRPPAAPAQTARVPSRNGPQPPQPQRQPP